MLKDFQLQRMDKESCLTGGPIHYFVDVPNIITEITDYASICNI